MISENSIIKQIFEDKNIIDHKTVIEYVQDLMKTYYSTLNNEEGEKAYLNNEDFRILTGPTYLRPNEIGMILSNPKIRVGGCKRELFLKINGAIKEDKELSEIETIERNNLVKQQWLDKFEFCKILGTYEDSEEQIVSNTTFRSFENKYMIDYKKNRQYTLLIKPLNDTAFSVRDIVWPSNNLINPKMMYIHLPEVAVLMYYYKAPVKLIYVGKNNTELFQEFNIGAKQDKITVNGVPLEFTSLTALKTEIENTRDIIAGNRIPPRDFHIEQILDRETIDEMVDLNIINSRTASGLYQGKPYTDFKCQSCKYYNLCQTIGEGWKTYQK